MHVGADGGGPNAARFVDAPSRKTERGASAVKASGARGAYVLLPAGESEEEAERGTFTGKRDLVSGNLSGKRRRRVTARIRRELRRGIQDGGAREGNHRGGDSIER